MVMTFQPQKNIPMTGIKLTHVRKITLGLRQFISALAIQCFGFQGLLEFAEMKIA